MPHSPPKRAARVPGSRPLSRPRRSISPGLRERVKRFEFQPGLSPRSSFYASAHRPPPISRLKLLKPEPPPPPQRLPKPRTPAGPQGASSIGVPPLPLASLRPPLLVLDKDVSDVVVSHAAASLLKTSSPHSVRAEALRKIRKKSRVTPRGGSAAACWPSASASQLGRIMSTGQSVNYTFQVCTLRLRCPCPQLPSCSGAERLRTNVVCRAVHQAPPADASQRRLRAPSPRCKCVRLERACLSHRLLAGGRRHCLGRRPCSRVHATRPTDARARLRPRDGSGAVASAAAASRGRRAAVDAGPRTHALVHRSPCVA